MNTATGIVLSGANNIFQVRIDGATVQCRIKGKVLKSVRAEYNVLAPGDTVEVESPRTAGAEAQVLSRGPRSNHISRWNRKRDAMQTLAANLSLVVAVASPVLPPFRPRFLDRVIAAAELGGAEVMILLNKIDQGIPDQWRDRLEWYRHLGYEIHEVSAATGVGIQGLVDRWTGLIVAMVGQSGVGKSTLINALVPDALARTGEVSEKHRRGRHVTTAGETFCTDALTLIDTPGIREIDLYPYSPREIAGAFREFRDSRCDFSGCTHLHEPGCEVKAAVEAGKLNEDRYSSYCNTLSDREMSARRIGVRTA